MILKNNLVKAFTLVELIVVVTILGILSTIAFVGFSGYTNNARDTTRASDMRTLEDGLNYYIQKSSVLPMPESYTTITASGTTIRYQGLFGKSVLTSIDLSNVKQGGGTDPKSKEYYGYVISSDKKSYQIVGYFEKQFANALPLVNKASAVYQGAFYRTLGEDLGFLINNTNKKPVHETSPNTTLDVRNTTVSHDIIFTDTDKVTGTGTVLFSNIANRDKKLLSNKSLSFLDNTLIGYWDMQTTTTAGSFTVMKDLSNYGNNASCYEGSTQVTCGGLSGPMMISGSGKRGNYMLFDGINDGLNINTGINLSNGFTFIGVASADSKSIGFEDLFNNGQFFLRRGPYIESILRPYEAFIGVSGNYEPRVNSNVSSTITGYNHVVVSRDKLVLKIYIDGELKKSQARTLSVGTQVMATIGKGEGTSIDSNYFDGTLDEIRLYNKVLSDAEILSLYESTK